MLVADDEEGILDFLVLRLEDEGFDCLTTRDGSDAWQIVRTDLPDVVLLDIVMPGLSGWDVAERMLADAATMSIPFIFMTAIDRVRDEIRGLTMGAFAFIVKPFDTPALVEVVRQAANGDRIMTAVERARRIEMLTSSQQ